jgi:RNA polymerase sigma-70 factor, ECF subfamily
MPLPAMSAAPFAGRQARKCRRLRVRQAGRDIARNDFQLRIRRPEELQERAEEELVQAFEEQRPRLLHALAAFLNSRQDAEDAVQNAFLRCWQARLRLSEIDNLSGWIWRVTVNAGRDLLDQAWRRRAKPLQSAEVPVTDLNTAPLELIIRREERQRLGAALALLRPCERDVFLYRQQAGLSFRAIARLRGKPIGTVKTLMHRALRKIRRFLADHAAYQVFLA